MKIHILVFIIIITLMPYQAKADYENIDPSICNNGERLSSINAGIILVDFTINFAVGALFFFIGLHLGRKHNLRVRDLWYIANLAKARKLSKAGKTTQSFDMYKEIIENIEEDIWLKQIDYRNLLKLHIKKHDYINCVRYCKKIYDDSGTGITKGVRRLIL